MEEEFNPAIIDILDLFYKLKDQYQKTFKNQYITPIVQSKASKIEKRKKYIALPKPKCVNCKRNVGTLFKIQTSDELNNKTFIAKCGDTSSPCPLSIKFVLPNTNNINFEINGLNDQSLVNLLRKEKDDIIILKNDAMFGFITKEQMTKTFNTMNRTINETGKIYENYINIYVENVMSPEKEEELKKIKEEFAINKQLFAEYMNEFKKTGNPMNLKNGMQFYVSSLVPLMKKITNLTYSVRYMELDENTNVYYLKLLTHTLAQMEVYYGNSKIIDKKVGMPVKAKPKTIKKSIKQTSAKTRKQLLIESEPEIEEQVEELEKEEMDEDSNSKKESDEEKENVSSESVSEQNQEGDKIDWGSDNTSPNSVKDSKSSIEQRDGEEEDEQRDEEQVDDEKKQQEEPNQIDDLELKIE